MTDDVGRAMERLRSAEHERRAAIAELIQLGVIRSRTLVGDLGEAYAAAYYGSELCRPSQPGYDLVTQDKDRHRVEVRTLRSTVTRNDRTTIGTLGGSYDRLFALRLDENYDVVEAFEIRREVVEEYFGDGRVSLTRKLEKDSRVRRVSAAELHAAWAQRRAPAAESSNSAGRP